MTDRELLELAAKAAGIELQWESDGTVQNRVNRPTIPYFCQGLSSAIDWNPLNDDSDALRLAVKLLFETDLGRGCVAIRHATGIKVLEAFNHDPYAATRRAIVRAAAEIGRGMK